LDKKLYLGNLDARRDWGYAPEYMEAAWLMLQQAKASDYVIGTGESHSVKDFVTAAFAAAGMGNWKKYVEFDKRYLRPTEVNDLYADTSKARKVLKWKHTTKFKDLVAIMVAHDMKKHGVDKP
jgi:GDPmannose 4,6-dehydratase